jgi:7-cyano-7-deazaguanine reductase
MLIERMRRRLAAVLKPAFMRVVAYWYPRGGMQIDVFWETGKLPTGIGLPDLGFPPYRGR